MKIKRTVTDKVIAANQNNSRSSSGPNTDRGKATSRLNALKSGLTAKTVLPGQEDNSDQQRIEERWRKDYNPKGVWEEKLIRDITFLERKDSILEQLEQLEISNLGAEAGDIFSVFDNDLKLPIDGLDLPLQRGWFCDRLIVRASSMKDSAHASGSRGPVYNQGQPVPGYQGLNAAHDDTGRHLEIQAVLGSRLDRILRYRAAITKDRYRAIEALHATQAQRREQEQEALEHFEKPRVKRNSRLKVN
jgi:hypothetical protein